jgi:hypothetical protein
MRRITLGLVGVTLLTLGVVFLVATGTIAAALGTPEPIPQAGASDAAAMTFWRQLTFIRMFGTAAIGLGAICVWCIRHLSSVQQASFLRMLAGVMAALVLMAVVQQTGIWGARAGWYLVAGLGVALSAALAGLVAGSTRQTA